MSGAEMLFVAFMVCVPGSLFLIFFLAIRDVEKAMQGVREAGGTPKVDTTGVTVAATSITITTGF